MSIEAMKLARKYIQAGAIVPVDMDTTRLLVDALRAAIEQAEKQEFNPDWDAMAVMVEEQQRMAKRIEELEQAEEQRPHYTWQYAKDYIASRQAEKQEPVVWRKKWAHKNGDEWEYSWFKRYHDAEPLYTAPPQREWQNAALRIGEELSSVGPDGYYAMSSSEWLDWALAQNPKGKTSLQQREWVGLTDEDEIDWEEGGNLRDLVKAIEAKLKEKNNG